MEEDRKKFQADCKIDYYFSKGIVDVAFRTYILESHS